jgi:hypothetical protein
MMIGRPVEWAHPRDDDNPGLRGIVVALERGGTPAVWSVLVLKDDGTFESCAADNLRVSDRAPKLEAPSDFQLIPGDHGEPTEGDEAIRALETLETFLEREFPDTNAGGGPIEHAQSILTQLKTELLETGTACDALRTANESLSARVKELQAAAKKRGGPAGPGAA